MKPIERYRLPGRRVRGTCARPSRRLLSGSIMCSAVLVGAMAAWSPRTASARAQRPASTAPAEKAPAGDAEKGQRLYKRDGCADCHGLAGQGSGRTGPRIGPDPIPYSAFLKYNRKPTGEMPPYTAKVLSDQDMADIYAFLKALPLAPDTKTIQLLQ
jgi:mono/diheme cytochrome c family protein